jgi:hypothetical protein
MKSFLLTWYGITDLRAALGLEQEGPIWGALKSGEYSDVIVLGYTNKDKKIINQGPAQKESLELIEEHKQSGKTLSKEDRFKIIDVFSNTEKSHRIFKRWLKEQINELELKINVKFYSVELEMLNDSKGISNAVRRCLDKVYLEDGEKSITAYISPGTPLMAFNWAWAALTNPEMDITIISSSDLTQGVEGIPLPYDIYHSKTKKRSQSEDVTREFDVVFHLFGEQRIPSLLGVMQFKAKRHVFVTSGKYPAGIMKKFVKRGVKYDEIVVDPFNPIDVKMKVLGKVSEFPQAYHYGFNLTGGTKLMYSGAAAACRKINGIPFYYENHAHKLIYLHNFSSTDSVKIPSIDHFFNLGEYKIIKKGLWEDDKAREKRLNLTNFLWGKRSVIKQIYRDLAYYTDRPGIRFNISHHEVTAKLDHEGNAQLVVGDKKFKFKKFPDFARYLCGGWFEEYTYKLFEPMLKQRKIKDLRIGMEVTWESGVRIDEAYKTAQEFDVIFTDGKLLYVIECKAGAVKSDHVYKLSDCVRNYGGTSARGILVSAFPLINHITRRRLREAPSISHFCESELNTMANRILKPN